MAKIENLRKYRQDGKVIAENMTFRDITALGAISKTIEIRWGYEGAEIVGGIVRVFGLLLFRAGIMLPLLSPKTYWAYQAD